MSCNVCIGNDSQFYDGPFDLFARAIRKARKPWRCCECGTPLQGKRYVLDTSLYDGSWGRERTCLECSEIRDVFSCGHAPPIYGELWETMRYAAFPELTTASECFCRLSADAKRLVLEQWHQWKFRRQS